MATDKNKLTPSVFTLTNDERDALTDALCDLSRADAAASTARAGLADTLLPSVRRFCAAESKAGSAVYIRAYLVAGGMKADDAAALKGDALTSAFEGGAPTLKTLIAAMRAKGLKVKGGKAKASGSTLASTYAHAASKSKRAANVARKIAEDALSPEHRAFDGFKSAALAALTAGVTAPDLIAGLTAAVAEHAASVKASAAKATPKGAKSGRTVRKAGIKGVRKAGTRATK